MLIRPAHCHIFYDHPASSFQKVSLLEILFLCLVTLWKDRDAMRYEQIENVRTRVPSNSLSVVCTEPQRRSIIKHHQSATRRRQIVINITPTSSAQDLQVNTPSTLHSSSGARQSRWLGNRDHRRAHQAAYYSVESALYFVLHHKQCVHSTVCPPRRDAHVGQRHSSTAFADELVDDYFLL